MAASPLSSPHQSLSNCFISPMQHLHSFLSLLLFAFFLSSLSFFLFTLYRHKNKNPSKPTSNLLSFFKFSRSTTSKKTHQNPSHPLFVDILTSNHTPKWGRVSLDASPPLLCHEGLDGLDGNRTNSNGSELDLGGEDCNRSGELKGKKKKRGKKKKQSLDGGKEEEVCGAENRKAAGEVKRGGDCLYPFTSAASATQRKIKQHYDQLLKSNVAKALTMAQVGQFANCLIEARNELMHKSEIIQRKFTITKALLFKADRSSFDRLYQQIYKLEAEQKRLEEDAAVYNRLQEQLKLSPAYKQMLEIAVRMESQARSGKLVESPDAEFVDISFEELLAQEKKDSFWQKNGRLKSCMS